jgi:uracil-DNA glycosylase family 4
VEADDLISWVADYFVLLNQKVMISTSDKDLWQLIGPNVVVHDHLRDMLVTPELVIERFGVAPDLLPDLRALIGDPSDNIVGAKGIGDKTALELIREYGSLGQLLMPENKAKLSQSKRTAAILGSDSTEWAYRLTKLFSLRLAKYCLTTEEQSILISKLSPNVQGDFRSLVDRVSVEANFFEYKTDLKDMAAYLKLVPSSYANLEAVDWAVLTCNRCKLRSHCEGHGPVLPDGYKDAEIMIVGRNPGHEELLGHKPFIGRDGKRLSLMLDALGLTRRDCWVTNVNKCYSANNRCPNQGEIMACSSYLRAEIDLLKPKFIIALGNDAMSMLTPYGGAGITKHCGEILDRPEGLLGPIDAHVAICVHPSMALRGGVGESHMKFATQKLQEFLGVHKALEGDNWDFDGETYDAEHDEDRLGTLLAEVKTLMLDGAWRTLAEIQLLIGRGSEAGISARLRDLRKEKFGAYNVSRRRRDDPKSGLFEYQLGGEF